MVQTRVIAYQHATTRTTSITPDAGATITKNDRDDDCRSSSTIMSSSSSSNNNGCCFLLEVSQKGKPILNPTEDTVKGPIRLRLVSSTLALALPSSSSQSQSQSQNKKSIELK